jgi:hypothetical protein
MSGWSMRVLLLLLGPGFGGAGRDDVHVPGHVDRLHGDLARAVVDARRERPVRGAARRDVARGAVGAGGRPRRRRALVERIQILERRAVGALRRD